MSTAGAFAQSAAPELRFEATGPLVAQIDSLRQLDTAPLAAMAELVGLENPGPPIRVLVAAEGSEEASYMPDWAVAYAVGNAGLVVLVPSRVPAYPDRTLETVLHHEVAHVLIARAARRRAVPRWFNEGVALVAARETDGWKLSDRGRLVLATVRRNTNSLTQLDRRFQAGAHTAGMAYALSGAFVRYLVDDHGRGVIAHILDSVGRDIPFPEAFRRATGQSLMQAEAAFWDRLDFWNKWLPFLTSSATLWILITALALIAFYRRRQRDAELVAQWEEEEERRHLASLPSGPWVH